MRDMILSRLAEIYVPSEGTDCLHIFTLKTEAVISAETSVKFGPHYVATQTGSHIIRRY